MNEHNDLMAKLDRWMETPWLADVNNNPFDYEVELVDAYRAYLAAPKPLVLEQVDPCGAAWNYNGGEYIQLQGKCYRLPEGE